MKLTPFLKSSSSLTSAVKPPSPKKTDPVQDELNEYVLSVPVIKKTGSNCNFNLQEKRDPITDKHKIAAVHDCQEYGLNLIMYLYNDDLKNRKESEFKMTDGLGTVTAGNKLTQCQRLSRVLSKCMYYMAPDNPRMGIMLGPGSYGLKFYTTNWVVSKDD